jgi:hypothetical protein
LTIDARCCVMSPDCIQNVDNSQPPAFRFLPPKPAGDSSSSPGRVRFEAEMVRRLDDPRTLCATHQKG